jgi:hypothetical protein
VELGKNVIGTNGEIQVNKKSNLILWKTQWTISGIKDVLYMAWCQGDKPFFLHHRITDAADFKLRSFHMGF